MGASKILIEEEEEDDDFEQEKSIKELEADKKEHKDLQAKKDDLALLVCMVLIISLTCVVVIFKVLVYEKKPDPNITTFLPLPQEVYDNKKYSGFGYIPCNGYVPCQPEYLT